MDIWQFLLVTLIRISPVVTSKRMHTKQSKKLLSSYDFQLTNKANSVVHVLLQK